MKIEYFIVNGDSIFATVYFYENLGRVVVIHGEMNPEMELEIHSDSFEEKPEKIDILEFIMKIVPKRGDNED